MGKTRKHHDFDERARDMMEDAYWDGYEDARVNTTARRFRRNKIDGNIGGVCAGIADYFGWDPLVVRLLFVISLFATGGTTFWVYVALWIFIPADNRAPYRREVWDAHREARRAPYNSAEPIERRTTSLSDVRSKFRSIETRMQDLERNITSKEWQLRRDFRDLED